MASKTSISVQITGDAREAIKAINQTTGEMMTMQQKTTTAVSGIASAIGSSAIVAKIGEIGKAAIDAAANLEQSVGGVDVVFKENAAQVHAWAQSAAQDLGLSQNAYNELATVIGSQLKNAGMSMDQVAGQTNDLITLGADLSSMFGGTTTQAVEALSSALKGEMDPIEAYGVSLNDATLQAQAASMGLGDLYKAGDRNAKMQATLAAITAQTGDATGNFAREADTAQGQQQRLNAMWENAQAALGQALLPAVTAVTQKLTEMVSWVQQNSSWLTPLAVVLGVVAAAIIGVNAAMSAYAAVAAIVAVAQGAVNVAFLPVVAVIVAVIAVVALLAANWDTVVAAARSCVDWLLARWAEFQSWFAGMVEDLKAVAKRMWDSLPDWAQTALSAVGAYVDLLVGLFTGDHDRMASAAQALYDMLPGWAQTGLDAAGNAVDLLVGLFTGDHEKMQQAARNLYDMLPGWAQNAVDGIVGWFNGMVSKVSGFFESIKTAAKNAFDFISGIFSNIGSAVSSAWDTVTGILPFSAMPVDMTAATMAARAYTPYTVIDPNSQGRSSGLPLPAARLLRQAAPTRPTTIVNNTYNLTFSDLMPDKDKVGRELRKLIEDSDRRRR